MAWLLCQGKHISLVCFCVLKDKNDLGVMSQLQPHPPVQRDAQTAIHTPTAVHQQVATRHESTAEDHLKTSETSSAPSG